jgi:hypothetical protein
MSIRHTPSHSLHKLSSLLLPTAHSLSRIFGLFVGTARKAKKPINTGLTLL